MIHNAKVIIGNKVRELEKRRVIIYRAVRQQPTRQARSMNPGTGITPV